MADLGCSARGESWTQYAFDSVGHLSESWSFFLEGPIVMTRVSGTLLMPVSISR